jgi:hypothetical protein
MGGKKRSGKSTSTRKKPTVSGKSSRKKSGRAASGKSTHRVSASKTKTSSKKTGSGRSQSKTGVRKNVASKPKTSVRTVARSPSRSGTGGKKQSKKPSRPSTASRKSSAARSPSGRKKGAARKKSASQKARKVSRSGGYPASGTPAPGKAATSSRGGAKIAKRATRRGGHKPAVKPPFKAYKGVRPYLFSSYAHKDMETVFRLLKRLDRDRYRIWYDEGIEPGNEWPEVVGNAVIGCAQFIVFMSPAAADSRNVRNEVNLAFTEDKDIIVLYLKKTDLSSGMKLQIGTVQFINQYELSERELYDKLTEVLNKTARN